MLDLQKEISALVDQFVDEVSGLARKAAMDTLNATLGGGTAKPARVTRAAGRTSSAPTARTPRLPKGAKRSKEDMAQLTTALLDHVRANPGQRIEQIKQAIGYTTAQLSLPMKKLIASGAVKSQGEKRATQYFPGKKS